MDEERLDTLVKQQDWSAIHDLLMSYQLPETFSIRDVKFFYYKALAALRIGDSKIALRHLTKLVNKLTPYWPPSKEYIYRIKAKISILEAYWHLGEFETAKQFLDQNEDEFTFTSLPMESYLELIDVLTILERIKGNIHWIQGELDKAERHYLSSLNLARKTTDASLLIDALNNLGVIAYHRGLYNHSLTYYTEALNISKSLNLRKNLSTIYNNMGLIYYQQGNLDEALKYHQMALNVRLELKEPINTGISFYNLATLYMAKTDFERAEYYVKEAIRIFSMTKNDYYLSHAYLEYVKLLLSSKQQEKLETVMEKLNTISQSINSSSLMIHHAIKLAKALYYKHKPNFESLATAKSLLLSIINDPVTEEAIHEESILNLCDLLIMEYKLFEDEQILQDALNYIKQLYKLGQEQGSFPLLAQVLLLQAKFEFIMGNFEKSKLLLEQALLLTVENGLSYLEMKVDRQMKFFEDELLSLEAKTHESNALWRQIQLSNLQDYLHDVIRHNF